MKFRQEAESQRAAGPFQAWAASLLLLAAVCLIDGSTSWEFGFSAFYLLPVVWLAWSRGRGEGIAMALVSGAAWCLVDRLSGRPLSSELFRYWDVANHSLSYLLAAWAVGTLRREIRVQKDLNGRLQAALAEVQELEGLLPVCAWCHRIRDDGGNWHSLEAFLHARTRATATHGICPACQGKLHAESGAPGEGG